jgi:hypothetical protein
MKITKLYKKLTLANLLNWLAMRFFRVASKFSTLLIGWAIYLDSSRLIFKKNFLYLSRHQGNRFLPAFTKYSLQLYSFPEGCKILQQEINFFDKNQTTILTLPKVINEDFTVSPKYACEAQLPDTYLAKLDDAIVFGGTDLIIVQNIVLYDEVNRNEKYIYGIKSPIIESIKKGLITIKLPKKFSQTIDCGIHFTKDHSKNYFHWTIECLPRLSIIEGLNKNIPLLVDDDLPSQFFEALQLVTKGDRKLIKINRSEAYKVKKLYYPSQLSIVHDNYKTPIYHKDAYYSPKAISFFRNLVLEALNLNTESIQSFRKIYISRKNSDYRQLLNSNDIENLLIAQGFEIVFPENLSFWGQVKLFSQAKIIVGQTGAGMANLIFANKNCKILMMASDAPQTNLHLFNTLAKSVDISIDFIIGKGVSSFHRKFTIHKDFYVDTKLILNYLENNL